MKYLFPFFFITLGGCTQIPVTQTGNQGEFVVVERHVGPLSNIAEAKADAKQRGVDYCTGMGKKFVEKYAIDRPRNLGQFPESTLYFTCGDPSVPAAGEDTKYTRLTNIKKLLDNGVLTQAEFEIEKTKILGQP